MESINHVSDTSFWIAAYRAEESDRSNAVFKDPFARKLAGEKGMQLMQEMPRKTIMAHAIAMRTTAIDRLIELCIAEGAETVINLAAGLDTRPYRMQLPAELRWIEVDFQAVIDYKTKVLERDRPVCRLTRIAADLADDATRKKLFAQLGAETRKALIITEGLITYLTNEEAAGLSVAIHQVPSFSYWIQNYRRGGFRNTGARRVSSSMKNASIMAFTAKDAFQFFSQQGWKVKQDIGLLDEGARFGRRLPAMFPWNILLRVSPRIRKMANRTFGVVLFER